jgi:hypothetical protein
VVFTNSSVGEKLRLYNDDTCFNEASEFSVATSPFVDNRLSTHRLPDNSHLMILLKLKFVWNFQKLVHYGIKHDSLQYFDSRLNA